MASRFDRRARRARGRRRFPSDGVEFLLDYADADTFARATEAAFVDPRPVAAGGTGAFPWDFVGGSEAANWKGNNVTRINSDGSVMIEGARTNKMPESSLNTWTLLGSASVSTDDATAPDGAANADTITYAASADDALTHPTTIIAGAGSDNASAMVSCWLRSPSGAQEARIGLMDKDTSTRLLSSDFTVTTTWTRFEFLVADIGAGAASPDGLIQNSTDAAARSIEAWGFQVEEGTAFKSSDIRTAGAAATQNLDDMSFAMANVPDALKSGRFAFTFWAEFDNSHAVNGVNISLIGAAVAVRQVEIQGRTANRFQLRLRGPSGLVTTPPDVVFSIGQAVTVTCDHVAGSIEIAGATAGNGVTVGTPTGGWAADASLFIGNNGTKATPFFGVISRPVAA